MDKESLSEAIAVLENMAVDWIGWIAEMQPDSSIYRLCEKQIDAIDLAIASLQKQYAYIEKQSAPISLKELPEEIGNRVWIVDLKFRRIYPQILEDIWSNPLDRIQLSEYGKTWIAYRQKPENGFKVHI